MIKSLDLHNASGRVMQCSHFGKPFDSEQSYVGPRNSTPWNIPKEDENIFTQNLY